MSISNVDLCEQCIYYPPSSFDGKPCSQCWPTDPLTNCFCPLEEVEDDE